MSWLSAAYDVSLCIESKGIERKIYREQKREVPQRKSVSKSSLLQDIKNADFRLRLLFCGGACVGETIKPGCGMFPGELHLC